MNDRVNRDWADRKRSDRGASERSPILYPSVVVGAPDRVRLTIAYGELIRRGTMAKLTFREYPAHILWVPSGDGLSELADQLGDNPAEWPGRMIGLEKVRRTNPRTGQPVEKYVIDPGPSGDERPARRMRPRAEQ